MDALVAALTTGGIAFGVYAQKIYEHSSYSAVATGSGCLLLSRTPASVAELRSLRQFTFEGVRFQYARGDVDCTTVRPGRLSDDEERPACSFDHPYFYV